MIDALGLSKSFGPHVALQDVSLHVEPGEAVAVVGPNGAGKTTLLRILATLSRPTAGDLRIFGADPARAGVGIRCRIGFLSHRTLLYEDLTAGENLEFYARLYRLPGALPRIDELLERVGLASRRGDLVRTYSRGMQQRLAVARALLHDPELLLLDEPYAGLDPFAVDELTALLAGLRAEGRTLLLTTHDLGGRLALAERAVVLREGRVVHDAPLGDPSAFASRYREVLAADVGASPRPSVVRALPDADPAARPEPRGGGVGAIIRKDLIAELHTREILNAIFVFALLALLIFSFALDLRGEAAQAAAPGIFWSVVVFAGTLGLNRSMAREHRSGAMEGLLLAPISRTGIFFGKALGNLALMLAVEAVLLPLGSVLFNVPLVKPAVLPVVLLGTVGYAAAGTLLAAIAVHTRAREVMLPILLLPLVIPLLIAAVRATGGLLAGWPWGDVAGWLRLLIAYDMVIVAVAMLTFDFVVEA